MIKPLAGTGDAELCDERLHRAERLKQILVTELATKGDALYYFDIRARIRRYDEQIAYYREQLRQFRGW